MKIARFAGVVGMTWAVWVSSVMAQPSLPELQNRMSGTWIATVEGEARKRVLTVTKVAQSGEGKFLVLGHYSYADDASGKIYPVKDSEIAVSGSAIALSFTSAAGATASVTAKSDAIFEGSVKYKNGQVKPIRLEKGAFVARKLVNKDELRQLITGKEVIVQVASTGNEISWTLGNDGTLYGWNLRTSNRDQGRWSVNESGQFCTEWIGRSTSGCLVVVREGEKLKFVIPPKMTPYADIKEIKSPK